MQSPEEKQPIVLATDAPKYGDEFILVGNWLYYKPDGRPALKKVSISNPAIRKTVYIKE